MFLGDEDVLRQIERINSGFPNLVVIGIASNVSGGGKTTVIQLAGEHIPVPVLTVECKQPITSAFDTINGTDTTNDETQKLIFREEICELSNKLRDPDTGNPSYIWCGLTQIIYDKLMQYTATEELSSGVLAPDTCKVLFIGGIRSSTDVAYLKMFHSSMLIGVYTDPDVAAERVQRRLIEQLQRGDPRINQALIEKVKRSLLQDPTTLEGTGILSGNPFTIDNSGSLDDLRESVKTLAKYIEVKTPSLHVFE